MNRENLPYLIDQEYLNSIKTRLNSKSKQNNNLLQFCKNNYILIFIIIILLIVCYWRYSLKNNGKLDTTKKKIISMQEKGVKSIKKNIKEVKKKNDEMNKPKFAIANDKKKLTKITNLPKQKHKPENNVKNLPNLQAANTESFFGANY